MRRSIVCLALLLATTPSFAGEPAAATATVTTESASTADVDRLLRVMDMKTMMTGMMQQMSAAQNKMVVDTFGKDLSDAERAKMQNLLAKNNAIVQKHMAWNVLEPVIRKVYGAVFSKAEVQAMTAFYASPEGASILKKSPQAMALTMQEIQPIIAAAMAEIKASIEAEAKPAKTQ